MCGTWTPPGVIVTVEFDDEALTLKLVKKTDIPEDEPISWMTFDVSILFNWHGNSSL
jgi:carboxy-cis,cis-muconate cyclase